MGRYCLTNGSFVAAELGEELTIQMFPHTFAVVNERGQPVCIPHGGCTLELISVTPHLEQDAVLGILRPGQTVHYEIQGTGQQERDIVTLKNGRIADLKDLNGCTFQITEEKHA